jgi:hypothetical protein
VIGNRHRRITTRRAVARMSSAAVLLAFLATGPGTSALEVAFHLVTRSPRDHARSTHFEAAGAQAHADHCRLGLTGTNGRVPTPAVGRLHGDGVFIRITFYVVPVRRTAPAATLPNSRAPPTLA